MRSVGSMLKVRSDPGLLTSDSAQPAFTVVVSTLARQTPSADDWVDEITQQLHSFLGARVTSGGSGPSDAHNSYWESLWNQSHIRVSIPGGSDGSTITQQSTLTRYLQIIQTGTWVPIKFNGEMFTAVLPPESSSAGP